MILNLLFTLLIIGGIILLVYWIIKQFVPGGPPSTSSTSKALEVLKERYARGEITEKEYERMKKELME